MIKATEWSNKQLFVIKQNRVNPPNNTGKNTIDDGKF